MAIGELYELIDGQRYLGQDIINVYHYENRRESGTAQALAAAWADQVLPTIAALQMPQVEHVEVEVINLDDDEDFGVFAASVVGTNPAPGDPLPSFYAARISIKRASRVVRNGAKRYAGIPEGGAAGNALNGDTFDALVDIATDLQDPIVSVEGGEWDLVIYGRPTPNRPSRVVVDVADIVPEPGVTTQNTRKTWIGT